MNHTKQTIQRKLTRVILVVCTTCILLVGVTFGMFHTQRMWNSMIGQTRSLCTMVAENTKAALEFESPGDARNTLNGLAAQDEFREAAIYDKAGSVFASYTRGDVKNPQWPAMPGDGHQLIDSDLVMFVPILHDDARVGTVYVRRESKEIREQLMLYLVLGTGVMSLALALAYFLARKLQGPITRPILDLARTATAIAETNDFSTRVMKRSDDEIGTLFEGFNTMLSELQKRDCELEQYRHELETRVEARTNELRISEARYRMLFESNPLPMWVYDLETRRFLAVNESAVNHYGYSRQQFLSMTVADARSEEDAETHYQCNGNAIFVETLGHLLSFENRPARLVSVNDITARKKAEAALKAANDKLLDASRRAGMAEVATGVLHNVGNVLNSVNVAATIIAERTQGLRVESLARAATLISEKGCKPEFYNTDQGRAVPGFLKKLADHFGAQRDFLNSEIQALTRNVEHIKQIVAMQQSYATTGGILGPVDARELIADSLKLVSASFGRHNIEVVHDYEQSVTFQTDKHRVIQILVNLFRNAAQAMRTVHHEKRITISILREDKRARICVSDTGSGISQEHLTRIFNHGFTTKPDGHGFGLHSGALAAKELGGSLVAESDGQGTGARFILELPLKAPNT
jgi:C4-dicarboxylate-specific signal transduction histidine kinase